jgi:hypothetical protein
MSSDDYQGDQTLSGHQLAAGRMLARLAVVVGFDKAQRVFGQCLAQAGLKEINSSQDMLQFCRALSKQGSELEPVSKLIAAEVIEAILRRAQNKLAAAVGPQKAQELFQLSIIDSGLSNVSTPEELHNFALSLIKHGGVAGVIGRSLKIQAMLGK